MLCMSLHWCVLWILNKVWDIVWGKSNGRRDIFFWQIMIIDNGILWQKALMEISKIKNS